MTITLWHNPRCSKSRAALALLEEAGHDVGVRRYLEDSPSVKEIKAALAVLEISPRDLMRKGEAIYKDLGLADEASDAALIKAMAENPILIERPVAFNDKRKAAPRAIIGRPPENVLEIV